MKNPDTHPLSPTIRPVTRRAGKLLALFASLLIGASLFAATPATTPPGQAIASAHPLATEAGMRTLKAGGNAFDAAVTVAAMLAVVEPYSSGLGGGGFWLLHRAKDGYQVMLDGRETAPLAAHADLYLDSDGNPDSSLSLNGPLAAAIPGVPAALARLADNYGKLPLATSLAPAIRLAKEGFHVDPYLHYMIKRRRDALMQSPAAAAIFLVNGQPAEIGSTIRQPDLARTLETLAHQGGEAFYRGDLAKQLVDGVRTAGGIWKLADLTAYQVLERQPVVGNFYQMRIVSAAPPSSGGIALIEALNIMQRMPDKLTSEADRIHWLVEAMRRAYRDRAEFLGDPDFVQVPVDRLISTAHADAMSRQIKADKATPSSALSGVAPPAGTGTDTTHYSIIDSEGNRVAATLSINIPFGSGFMVPGTGVLLNDEMDDFSAKPGSPNAYGLIGNAANAIAPGKRPLSSMTPSFLETPDGVAILGTPGGSRIISMLMLATLGYYGQADAASLVSRPRFHHQYLPDTLFVEPGGFSAQVRKQLEQRGHALQETTGGQDNSGRYGNMQVVIWDRRNNRLQAASDPRGVGSALVSGSLAVEKPGKKR
jgi:gamma-glutamyltranspeptidase/glutathione hydrolase